MNRRSFFKLGAKAVAASAVGIYGARAMANEFDLLLQGGAISIHSLQFIREEEKLARDVYIGLYQKWGSRIFDNISGSEQTHTDKVKYLLEKYEIEDPAAKTRIGEFMNPKIQNLYNDLIARGYESSREALYVGAYVEELDIGDLRREINESSGSDIKQVYTNLMYGSYNHLGAFVRQIERRGTVYKAQILDQKDVDLIISR